MDLDSLIKDARQKMQKVTEHLLEELISIRSGRATPALIENTKIEAYGSAMPLRDLASINAPEPRLLVVQPWDQNNVETIVKALRENGMGFNPIAEGNVIRVAVPALSEERRNQLIKLVSEKAENARVAIRGNRRETLDQVDRREKSGEISKDDAHRSHDSVQKLTDEMIAEIDKVVQNKEAELREV